MFKAYVLRPNGKRIRLQNTASESGEMLRISHACISDSGVCQGPTYLRAHTPEGATYTLCALNNGCSSASLNVVFNMSHPSDDIRLSLTGSSACHVCAYLHGSLEGKTTRAHTQTESDTQGDKTASTSEIMVDASTYSKSISLKPILKNRKKTAVCRPKLRKNCSIDEMIDTNLMLAEMNKYINERLHVEKVRKKRAKKSARISVGESTDEDTHAPDSDDVIGKSDSDVDN